MIGKTLGHYRVGEQLGQGGMGEVYLADDLSLGRKVALKFLPEAFTGDPERMARFEREAKLLASLNHPNIAAIYGLEQAEGKRFLVLELVEGETLGQRLSKGALPIEEVLGICRQIADGLEAAHEKGVIHRDLKPANVMITEGDKVKILDFGLAKALSDETQSVDSSQSPTLTEAMTRPGVILGTAAYMSPEQAKGKAVDKRADIWAFGCILYECLTGKRAFEGETATETLASVLKNEPDWQALPSTTPPNIRFVLRRCLEKNVKSRFHCVGDLQILIEEKRGFGEATAPVKRPWPLWTWAAIATVLVIAMAVPTYRHFGGREQREAFRFHLSVPPMPDDYSMALSPDGSSIAFIASSSKSVASLFLCKIGSVMPEQLEGTEGAAYPFWSPDSRSIGFFAGGRLKRVDVSGGPPRDICAAPSVAGGSWNTDGVIVFGDNNGPLRRVSAAGGEPAEVTAIDESQREVAHIYPCFLPDGRHYLYTVLFRPASKNGIYAGSIDSREKTRLLTGMSLAIYAEPGYLLFQREGTVFARPFDVKKLQFSGQEVRIADRLAYNLRYGWAAVGASRNNVLIYRAGGTQAKSRLVWFDRIGKQLEPAGEPGMYMPEFDLSPDGKQLAMTCLDPATSNFDIWILDLIRNVPTRFTNDPDVDQYPVWSPDGLRIAFTSHRKGSADLFVKQTSGVAEESALMLSPANENQHAWSKDGRYIAYVKAEGAERGIFILPLFGDKKPFPMFQSSGRQYNPDFSFDGKWLAYQSNESGTYQVYVLPFPAADRKRQISNNGGVQPRWRGDGKELYYLSLDGKMMAVDIKAETEIESGVPRMPFDTELNVDQFYTQYALTPDGRRFLLLKPLTEAVSTPITIVFNWISLLKK